jgi:hypothetical protein
VTDSAPAKDSSLGNLTGALNAEAEAPGLESALPSPVHKKAPPLPKTGRSGKGKKAVRVPKDQEAVLKPASIVICGRTQQLDWPPSDVDTRPGFINGDNSCYGISVLRCLVGIPSFRTSINALPSSRTTRGK